MKLDAKRTTCGSNRLYLSKCEVDYMAQKNTDNCGWAQNSIQLFTGQSVLRFMNTKPFTKVALYE